MKITTNVTTKSIQVETNIKTQNTLNVGLNVKVSGSESLPTYEGDYIIVPNIFEEKNLQTKNKKLTDNVTVTKVPYAKVHNNAGGETVTIGETLILNNLSLAFEN